MGLALFILSLSISLAGAMVCHRVGECYHLQFQECKHTTRLTLHGLWPQWGDHCEGPGFSLDAIAPLRGEMEADWPSCPEHGRSDEEFWAHEWKKHGKCSGMGQLEYFTEALKLARQYKDTCAGETCAVCLSRDLRETEKCAAEAEAEAAERPSHTMVV
mmetsp:Transcript_38525/g.108972  ORF Transcript_38525/g.108972 Transcript_38525/m.108972 type:complete len:159 (-) Transcript_38525:71-547(-)